jgi:uncharacterized protein (TIGR03067 family)
MRRVCCTLALLAVTLASLDGRADDARAIQGKWKLVGFERGGVGQPQRPLPAGTMTFEEGGRFSASFPEHEMGGTVRIDPVKKPAAMDFTHTVPPDKGKTMFAIYKLEGDKFTLCAAPPGRPEKERPTRFATRDTDRVLFVFERVK